MYLSYLVGETLTFKPLRDQPLSAPSLFEAHLPSTSVGSGGAPLHHTEVFPKVLGNQKPLQIDTLDNNQGPIVDLSYGFLSVLATSIAFGLLAHKFLDEADAFIEVQVLGLEASRFPAELKNKKYDKMQKTAAPKLFKNYTKFIYKFYND